MKKWMKWGGIALGCIVALFLTVCTLAVWILTPPRLTPIVRNAAESALDARVGLAKVELTFWRTFPHLTVDVDSLTIVSNFRSRLTDSVAAKLPADADTLLTLKSFHGGVDVLPLLVGHISLHDVEFVRPTINMVQANDTVGNYQIVPPSKEEVPADTSALELPRISINRFRIANGEPIRYRSLQDSLDVAINLKEVALTSEGAPEYKITVDANATTEMLAEFNANPIAFGADGCLTWDSDRPMAVSFSGFTLRMAEFGAKVDAALDFTHEPMVSAFEATTDDIQLTDALRHLPKQFVPYVEGLKTDMKVKANVRLKHPWNLADSILPSLTGAITIPPCRVDYDTWHFSRFTATFATDFDGSDINASTFTVKGLEVRGAGMDASLDATVTHALTDPEIEGKFSGLLTLSHLPRAVAKAIPGKVSGQVEGKADFRFHVSDFSEANFHRIFAKGELKLTDFDAQIDSVGRAYTHRAELNFGSSNAFVADNGAKVDSLLTLSLNIDTLAAQTPAADIELKNFRAGAGSVNRASSADTTEINPFGMKMSMGRLKLSSPADSIRLWLDHATANASLMRYKGDGKLPLINASLGIGRLLAGQGLNRVALKEASAQLKLHKRKPRVLTAADSARIQARRQARKAAAESGKEIKENDADIHFELDGEERSFLRHWDFSGHIKATRGRLVTPAFPLRNTLSHVDFTFNPDSLQLRELKVTTGQSDFLINGTVSNLRRALIGRRNNTLGLTLSVMSDTINVNEIVKALFAGGAMKQTADSAMVWNDKDLDGTTLVASADTASTGPLLVPRNVKAEVTTNARNVLYSDLVLHDLRGALLLFDGALNLSNLSASTDMGSIQLDGLYESLNPDSLQFGLGMKVDRFRLDRLSSLIPAIDSLLPAMKGFAGIVNADLALTTGLTPQMDVDIPSLRAALKISGDSLVLLDADTFKSISKWLLFRDKKHNMIDHMAVEVLVENSTIELFPFMFDIDRYKLGVMGHNDMAMNLNYHVSVLKSPIPFKFGINIKGTPEKMKIRLGGAKVKENMVGERQAIADNTRINIVKEIDNVFRRGISKARLGRLSFQSNAQTDESAAAVESLDKSFDNETLSYTDSLQYIRAGLIENPDSLRYPMHDSIPAPAPPRPVKKRK